MSPKRVSRRVYIQSRQACGREEEDEVGFPPLSIRTLVYHLIPTTATQSLLVVKRERQTEWPAGGGWEMRTAGRGWGSKRRRRSAAEEARLCCCRRWPTGVWSNSGWNMSSHRGA